MIRYCSHARTRSTPPCWSRSWKKSSRGATVGAAFAMDGGMPLEEIRLYVPYGAYARARELLETIEGAPADEA